MATQKKATAQQADESLHDIVAYGNNKHGLSYDEAFDLLDKVNDAQLKELSSDYWAPEEMNKIYSFLLLGMDVTQFEGKDTDIVKLKDREGKLWINGDKVIVSACKRVENLPCYIRVTWTGNEKSAKGQYKTFSVKTVPIEK